MDLTDNLSCSPSKMDILLELELPENKDTEFSIALSNNRGEEFIVGFDSRKNEYFSDRTKAGSNQFSDKFAVKRHSAPRTSTDKIVRLHLIFDVASCELFADNGLVAMTEIFFPTENFSRLKLSEKGGGIKVKNAQIRCVK
jgi:fructan beta-fructosidase